MPVALITGASRGLGLVLARTLARRGWSLALDARAAAALEAARLELAALTRVVALPGSVADPEHARVLVRAAADLGALVNNAGSLGPTPLPPLLGAALEALRAVFEVNALAPLRLIQLAAPRLVPGARIANVSSDAAVEGYPGWGLYGSAKAALEALTRSLAAEQPRWRVYALDPGDMRTRMQQDAFPGEDISDRTAARGPARPACCACWQATCPAGATPPPGWRRWGREGREKAAAGGGEAAPGGRPAVPPPHPFARARPAPPRHGGAAVTRPALDFRLPPEPEAHQPPEARGLTRGGCACWSRRWRPAACGTPASATCPSTCGPATCWC